MSTSSAFSINVPFIFEIQLINGALLLNAKGLSFLSLILLAPSLALTVLIPYASL